MLQLRSLVAQFGRLGLQRRIMLYVSGGLIVIAAAYTVVSLQAIKQSTNLESRERLIVAEIAAHQIDSELSHLGGEINDLSSEVGTALAANQPAQAWGAMNALYQHWLSYDHFTAPLAVILTDPNGVVLSSEPPPAELLTRDFSTHPFFQAALKSQHPIIADEYSLDANGHGSLFLVTPILASGRISGVLIGNINLSQVSQQIDSMLEAYKPGYSQELINENGEVIASTKPNNQWHLSDHFSLIKDQLAHNESGTVTHNMPEGSTEPTHIVAFTPLSTTPWYMVAEEPQDVALALPNALEYRLIFFGAVMLLAGLVMAWVTTRAVVRPVNALIDVTQRIAAGDLDHPLDVAAEDEVGRLARSFYEMRVELKESHEVIASLNRNLEARIRQRTRELSGLVKSSQALAATLDLDMLFDILIKETHEVVPLAEGIVFFLFDGVRGLLTARSSYGLDYMESQRLGFRVDEGIAGKVFKAQAPLRLGSAEEVSSAQSNLSPENDTCFQRAFGGRTVKSSLGVPLISKGDRLGALVLYNVSCENAFTENDVTVLQAFANQATAAIENARLYASLREKEAARAALLEQAIQAQEEERARVAREIHDELGQLLTRLSIDLKMCESQITDRPEQAARTLAATQTLVWQTMEQAHHLIVELRPTLLDELGLEAALREELTTRLGPLGVTATLKAEGTPERLPATVEITTFRIAQEAISNIALHAHAQHASLLLTVSDTMQMCIEDDGRGIPGDWRSAADGHRPLGLLGMQERAALIGGTLTIEPVVPQGTRVTLRVPLASDGSSKEETD